jgi:hypothetical protein
VARRPDEQPRKRFSKSGHTSHTPRARSTDMPPGYRPPPQYNPPPQYGPPPQYPPGDGYDPYGRPTYHRADPAASPYGSDEKPQRTSIAITKAAVRGTNRAARVVTRKVISASKADGAQESGLTALIWNQVLSYGTDAMVTVALAGSVFFGASTHAQRGNVLLYLLITMAPFAVVAPVIGPLLDRLQHGRRWTMAGTAVLRGILALIMAKYSTELLVLYPCALGSLVCSKAYGVIRAAAAPRLVPPNMTLTEANARLSIFGLGSTLVLGGLVGLIIKITGSYSLGLFVTAIGFFACAVFAFKLPENVDSATAAPRHPQEPARPRVQQKVPPLTRLQAWARRGFDEHIVLALQGESALRLLSGLLTIYLAFYIETTQHGLKAAVQLAGVVGAAGLGNALGTAVGTRIKMNRPELVIIASVCVAAVACLMVSVLFDIVVAIVGMLVSAITNALSKNALDALIQRDIAETLRSTAFGKSETFLQLAWVLGAAIGVVLPSSQGDGFWGFVVGTVVVGAAAVVIVLRQRLLSSSTGHLPTTQLPIGQHDWPKPPGTVAHDPHYPAP